MIYPKRPPSQAKLEDQNKKLISKQQREQLKAAVTQKLQEKYPSKDPEVLQEKINNFFSSPTALTAQNLRQLDKNVALSEQKAYGDRDDISVKSGISKMSGATDFLALNNHDETGTQRNGLIDLNLTRKKPQTAGAKKYKNEEEEWADIYEYNLQVAKAEAQIEKERIAFNKIKYKNELNDQVDKKFDKNEFEKAENKRVELEQVLKKCQKEDDKEAKKQAEMREKIVFEKEIRSKQIKDNKMRRRQEAKEEKQLDRYIMNRLREEQIEEEREAKRKRAEDYAYYRRMLLQNEEDRLAMIREREQEKLDENRQIQYLNKLVEEREKQRAAEDKAKDAKTREKILAAKDCLGKPSNEMERRQDLKVQKWAIKKQLEDEREEREEKEEALRKKKDTKKYLTEQMEEKKVRQAELKKETDAQASVWVSSADEYNKWMKQKEEDRKKQMKTYAEVLKKQMNEKFEERRITDRLFDLRATLNEQKEAGGN